MTDSSAKSADAISHGDYLRCPGCMLTLKVGSQKVGNHGSPEGTFRYLNEHSWRCENCGHEGSMKHLEPKNKHVGPAEVL